MKNLPDEIKNYLAEIGRKGGKAPSPHKKYNSNAERQKAWRQKQKEKKDAETERGSND